MEAEECEKRGRPGLANVELAQACLNNMLGTTIKLSYTISSYGAVVILEIFRSEINIKNVKEQKT